MALGECLCERSEWIDGACVVGNGVRLAALEGTAETLHLASARHPSRKRGSLSGHVSGGNPPLGHDWLEQKEELIQVEPIQRPQAFKVRDTETTAEGRATGLARPWRAEAGFGSMVTQSSGLFRSRRYQKPAGKAKRSEYEERWEGGIGRRGWRTVCLPPSGPGSPGFHRCVPRGYLISLG